METVAVAVGVGVAVVVGVAVGVAVAVVVGVALNDDPIAPQCALMVELLSRDVAEGERAAAVYIEGTYIHDSP